MKKLAILLFAAFVGVVALFYVLTRVPHSLASQTNASAQSQPDAEEKLPPGTAAAASRLALQNSDPPAAQDIPPNSPPLANLNTDDASPDPDAHRRTLVDATFQRLSALPDPVPEAKALLASPEGKVRETAGIVLAHNGSHEAVSALLTAIKAETDSAVRENLVESLRSVSNPQAVPALAAQAQDLSDLALHRVCRNAMSAMTDPAALAQLLEILDKNGNAPTAEPIAYAVAHMTSPQVTHGLLQGTASENDRVASACIQGLGNLASADAFLALLQLAGEYENSERGQVAASAATQAAIDKKDERYIEVCLKVMGATTSFKAWQTAVDSLVAISSPKALSALQQQSIVGQSADAVAYLQDAIARHKKLSQD
jgi:HEAT repeat protein